MVIAQLRTAYTGNLMASLTFPAKQKPIDTFDDVAKIGNGVTLITLASTSMHSYLKHSNDSIAKVVRIYVYERAFHN